MRATLRLAALLVVVLLAPAGPAAAHKLSKDKAWSAAREYTEVFGMDIGASGDVLTCDRRTRHRFVCRIEMFFEETQQLCHDELAVKHKRHKKRRGGRRIKVKRRHKSDFSPVCEVA